MLCMPACKAENKHDNPKDRGGTEYEEPLQNCKPVPRALSIVCSVFPQGCGEGGETVLKCV